MAYEKTTWVDGETEIDAQKLNKIEEGIVEAGQTANNVVDTFNVEDKTTNAPSIRAVEEYIDTSNSNRALYLGCKYLGKKFNNFDLNNLGEGKCCYYSTSSLPTNYPATNSNNVNYIVYCFRNISDYGSIQIAWSDGSSNDTLDSKIYIRKKWGTSWSSWRKITTS